MEYIGKDDIPRLIEEAINETGMENIYKLSFSYVDFEAMQKAQPIIKEDLCKTFAVAGFAAGMQYVFERLDIIEEEKRAEP